MEESVKRIVSEVDESSLKAAAEKDFAFREKSNVERIVREADKLSLEAAVEKDFASLEKSNAKKQQAIQMKSEIEKTTESVSKIEKKIKEL